jgi:hypothetical protein
MSLNWSRSASACHAIEPNRAEDATHATRRNVSATPGDTGIGAIEKAMSEARAIALPTGRHFPGALQAMVCSPG